MCHGIPACSPHQLTGLLTASALASKKAWSKASDSADISAWLAARVVPVLHVSLRQADTTQLVAVASALLDLGCAPEANYVASGYGRAAAAAAASAAGAVPSPCNTAWTCLLDALEARLATQGPVEASTALVQVGSSLIDWFVLFIAGEGAHA